MAKYTPDSRNRCPHCRTVVRFEPVDIYCYRVEGLQATSLKIDSVIATLDNEDLCITYAECTQCGKLVLTVETGAIMAPQEPQLFSFKADKEFVVLPLQSARAPVPKEVDENIAEDYKEAALVLSLSPKASAALSRRCLQAVLRGPGEANQHDLSHQIDAVIPNLPTYISDNVDAVRNIGNFAAHPLKSEASGQIVDVEAGEAEWNLDVLDMLFDFYYVQPAIAKKKRDALNKKLKASKKPPMKGTKTSKS